jgi:phosphoglycerate kinase
VGDKVPAVRFLLRRGVADVVLVGGLVGLTFLKASGYRLGKETEAALNVDLVEEARAILAKFGDKIVMPMDVAWEENGERVEGNLSELRNPSRIVDVGAATCDLFRRHINEAKTTVMLGPMGAFERPDFDVGTRRVLRTMLRSKAFTIAGGGHLTSLIEKMGIDKAFGHVSTGGGALLYVLSGREMPVLRALRKSARAVKRTEISLSK